MSTTDLARRVGLTETGNVAEFNRKTMIRSIVLKLAAMGCEVADNIEDQEILADTRDLFARYREQSRLLSEHLNPADQRIQTFLDRELGDLGLDNRVRVPSGTLILDRFGLARELSIPHDGESWHSDFVSSYRLGNGVLHNPVNDRRTTKGVFHIAETGLSVPGDKVPVPLIAYAHLLRAAFAPPAYLKQLPFTARWERPVEMMASLLIRPLVCPEVPGVSPEKRTEVRFFAPGGLVSNLDFVESIFGNAGDPFLPDNDAGLDVDHWTGHSGCVVLAPHLLSLKKKDLGLPPISEATPRQKQYGMCWADEFELYNNGQPFKITARTMAGVMVTILADNYFGYCKKEVKTQIGFSANLFGLAEEEHSGGALAFSASSLGDRFLSEKRTMSTNHRFKEALELLGDAVTVHPEGHATDKRYATIHYLPEDMEIDLKGQDVKWTYAGEEQHLKLLPGHTYLHPSGYKLRMEKHQAAPSWRLVGTVPEGTFCHKPCTVSGGGKSEISKSLVDAILYGPIYVNDFERDMSEVEEIINRDYDSSIYLTPPADDGIQPSRPILSQSRSLGSVIKLLTPNEATFTPDYNRWLLGIPNHIRALVFVIKRFYRQHWDTDWRRHFSVDIIDGSAGHELKYDGRRLVGSYLRVGRREDGSWRTYKLRQDFVAADKVQMEDDISASVVVPASKLEHLPHEYSAHPSLKLSENCEWRLFQRPDDAAHPGFDRQAERDLASPGAFISNFQPLRPEDHREILQDVMLHGAFTEPMQAHIAKAAERSQGFDICSARSRLVGGKPTQNPRYLQVRPDVADPQARYVAEVGARLYRRTPSHKRVVFPVISVLSGRRNNPPESGIRPLCVFNPLHYQELPELFMDYVCSVTGKSPSTTGAGSEGALTKGPFNAIAATADLNSALVSMLLCNYAGFSSAAGYIGPNIRVDHDISLLIPEIWCRLFPAERDPANLIRAGHLEKLEDYEFEGQQILASRLGYRITGKFVHTFMGRVFDNPMAVFTDELLRPELQDPAVFANGVQNIVEAQQHAAQVYFTDGTVECACPPLKALLHIMVAGTYQGKTIDHPEVRALFTRDSMLGSAWYKERLRTKQVRDLALWQQHTQYLGRFLAKPSHRDVAQRLDIQQRWERAKTELERVADPSYLLDLQGTIGADPVDIRQSAAVDGVTAKAAE